MVKTVLCYGDSLTWGADPAGPSRHEPENRWPAVLQAILSSGVEVISEGLCGRTTAYDDHSGVGERNGAKALPMLLSTHQPLDLVILMLGTNDLKPHIAGTATAACVGMRRLIEIVRHHPFYGALVPEIIVVAPPHRVETADAFSAAQFGGVIGESQSLSMFYADMADELECGFFDASSVSETSGVDGVHLDVRNTRAIGQGLAPMAKLMLGV